MDPVSTDFSRLFAASKETWQTMQWCGFRILKNPCDLFIYQEILWEKRPDLIIETGTAFGGSALYLAHLLDHIGHGSVTTIDIAVLGVRPVHPRIRYITGSSTDADTVKMLGPIPPRTMVILDSDHQAPHVLKELELLWPLVGQDQYLIVEDTDIPGWWQGPGEAVRTFLQKHPEFEADRSRERLLFTFNPGGYLLRK